MTPAAEMLGTCQQLVAGDYELLALNAGVQRNRVAASLLADGRNVDRRGAVFAHHVAATLIVPLAAANPAGVREVRL